MSIVTRGLSAPDALLVTFGLGAVSGIIIVCPLEQLTAVTNILQSTGIREHELNVSIAELDVAVAVIEYRFDSLVDSPAQIAEVIDRLTSISLEETDLNIEIVGIDQEIDLVEVIQSVSLEAPTVSVKILEMSEDVSIHDSIDKVQND